MLLALGAALGVIVIGAIVALASRRPEDVGPDDARAQGVARAALPRPPQGGPSAGGGASSPASGKRSMDLTALGETTAKIVLDPTLLAEGAADPLPGLPDAYEKIARGDILAHLQVIAGPVRGRAAELLPGGRVTVGRGHANTLDLKDPGTSLDQCAFEASGTDVMLTDLGSRNGTFVNGDRIQEPRRLASCDIVACGASRILVTLAAAPASMTE